MRTISEIKAAIEKWDAMPMDETRMFTLRSLRRALKEAIIDGIPLDRLEAICDAERDGRCAAMPCKVGDAVYTVDLDCRDNPDQSKMCFCWNKSCKDCDKAYLRVWENHTKTADVRSIVSEMGLCGEKGGFGKTVFLTREEAEAAIAND